MQLISSEQPQAHSLWDESARIAYIFDDYKQCVELNKKSLNLKHAAGLSGMALVPNHVNMGLAYLDLSEYNEAINSLTTALNLDPMCAYALINLSLVYKKQGNLDKALGYLQDIVSKVDPRDTAAINNIGNIYAEQGKHEMAAMQYL
jgi:tetratricopeptide (TPR) repeat protein